MSLRALLLGAVGVAIPVAAAHPQMTVDAAAFIGVVGHQVDVGTGSVRMQGALPGGFLEAHLGSTWDLQLLAREGHLGAGSDGTERQSLAEISSRLDAALTSWFSVQVRVTTRAFTTPLDRQRWFVGALGGEVRLPFSGDDAMGIIHLAVPLVVRVNGLPAPGTAAQGGVGLRYRWRGVWVRLYYELERYDFPPVSGRTRLEDLSELGLQFEVPVLGRAR
jgi:hypothetical protein